MRRTSRFIGIAALALVVMGLTASSALAALTFKSGPTVTFGPCNPPGQTLCVTATANISGLGNVPAIATLQELGTAQYQCTNKGNPSNIVQGQNPQPAQSNPGVQDLGNSQHNGRADLNVSSGPLVASQTIDPVVAGCPNSNWTATLVSLTLTGAQLTITQGGQTIYSQFFPAP
jgi:hypothetical protein